MTKTIIINVCFFFISFSIFSQQQIDIPVQLYKEISLSKNINEYLGSVYVFKDFRAGILNFEGRQLPIKFNINAYTNSICFINNVDKIHVLNYNPKMNISIGNQKFNYLKVDEHTFVVSQLTKNNENTLYKSYFSKITPPRPSLNGYDLPKPGKIEIKTNFIFFVDGKYSIVPKNKKAITNTFPDYKGLIKSYKLRFKSEVEFIKFFNLL